jgi:Tol biopolymer transport system component
VTELRASVVALAAALAVVPGASGAFPGLNGRIAYFAANEIFTIAADGTGARSLGPGLSPAWSPNGRELAFDVLANQNYDVWVMRRDGTGRRRVTTNPAVDFFASWSPDGTSLVFTSDRGGEDLYVIGADGSGERRLTTDPAPEWGAAWEPEGRVIAFAGNARGNLEIEVVGVDGTGRHALTNHPARDYDPAWSPDSSWIAFTSERDGNANIYVQDAGLNQPPRQLTDDPANDWRPAWSPDGTKIVFESDRDPGVFDRDLYVMNVDGSDERRLRSGDENARDADWQPTIDLTVAIERRLRRGRALVTVINRSPIPEIRIVLTVTAGQSRRVVRFDSIGEAGASGRDEQGALVPIPRTVRRVTASVSSWRVDSNPANNRVTVRVRR